MLKNKDAHLTLHWQINVPSEKLKFNLKANFQNETESQADCIFHACSNANFERLL